MTIQSYRVLKDLLKCQSGEGSEIFVNYEDELLIEIAEEDEPQCTVKFRYSPDTMRSIFSDLSGEGYISGSDDWFFNITVTHRGNHTKQRRVELIFDFLLKSVLVPIAVSLATSFAYNLIFG